MELQKAKDKGKKSSGRVIQRGVKRAESPTFRHMEVQTDDSETEWVYIDRNAKGSLEENLLGNSLLDSGGLAESPEQVNGGLAESLEQVNGLVDGLEESHELKVEEVDLK